VPFWELADFNGLGEGEQGKQVPPFPPRNQYIMRDLGLRQSGYALNKSTASPTVIDKDGHQFFQRLLGRTSEP
jgi:hypothetical protein